MTKNLLRSLAVAALACTGANAAQAQTVLQLSYPSAAPGAVPCIYTTNSSGISADPQTGNLLATGDFTSGCPQTGPVLPLPVIVPGPAHWQLPNPWAVGQVTSVQWAAANAETCTYGGSFATGWPSGQNACASIQACQTLHDVSLSPPTAGQYQFNLTCSNATGNVTSTSQFRDVAANPPVITQGPTTWNVLPWTSGQSKSVVWSANNADNCGFTVNSLPSGVTPAQFFAAGTTTCSSVGACAAQNALVLSAPVAGTYGVTLTCTRSTGGTATSTQSWNVTQSSSANCLNPAPGWNRLEQSIVYSPFTGGIAGIDVTQYASIWGRDYANPGAGYPIIAQWPGVEQQLVIPAIGSNQYVAAKFRTPASGQHYHGLMVEQTSFLNSGGGVGNTARISGTVSTKCGDFNTASVDIPAYCKWSQRGSNETMDIGSGYTSGNFCRLQPNTDYYLNLIYAPLTSPASAVFNGVNGSGPYLQNTNVIP